MKTIVIAACWGFAEATLFFIVPDVFFSLLAVNNRRLAWQACLGALGGALLGGVLMYVWGVYYPETALSLLDSIPAISNDMIAGVGEALTKEGYFAMLLGPLSGTPYKLYAVQSGALRLSFASFLVMSVPARLIRFLIITFFSAWISKLLSSTLSCRIIQGLVVALWSIFYLFYFIWMPN